MSLTYPVLSKQFLVSCPLLQLVSLLLLFCFSSFYRFLTYVLPSLSVPNFSHARTPVYNSSMNFMFGGSSNDWFHSYIYIYIGTMYYIDTKYTQYDQKALYIILCYIHRIIPRIIYELRLFYYYEI